MLIPKNEKELREILQLDIFLEDHPTPPFNSGMMFVVDIDGKTYTEDCIRAAVDACNKEKLEHILQYPNKLLSHNNLGGPPSSASKMTIRQLLGGVYPNR